MLGEFRNFFLDFFDRPIDVVFDIAVIDPPLVKDLPGATARPRGGPHLLKDKLSLLLKFLYISYIVLFSGLRQFFVNLLDLTRKSTSGGTIPDLTQIAASDRPQGFALQRPCSHGTVGFTTALVFELVLESPQFACGEP